MECIGTSSGLGRREYRDSIFQAFKRKETFATTGTRMAVRFFAGFDMESIDMDSEDMVKMLIKGVTMGADLFSQDNQTPQFLVWAQRDKLGAPLQRVQIIKGWVEMLLEPRRRKFMMLHAPTANSDPLLIDVPIMELKKIMTVQFQVMLQAS